MGFFDNQQTFTEDPSYNVDGEAPPIIGFAGGKLNWNDAGNTQSQLTGIDLNNPLASTRLQGLIDAWAKENDPSYAATFGASPFSTNNADSSNLYTEGGGDPSALIDHYTRFNEYVKSKFGDGQLAVARTNIGGSDSDGVMWRNDLVQRQPDGSWRPVKGATTVGSQTGYKSDGKTIAAIIASWAGGVALAGSGAGAGAAAEGGATAGSAGTGTTGVTGANGAFLGEGVASGIPAWDSSYVAAGGTLGGGAAANEGVLDWSAERPPETGDGAFLGEGTSSGVPEWDAAYAGAGGSPGAGASTTTTYQPEYNFDPNGLPDGSSHASDFAGAGGGTPAPGAGSGSGGTDWGRLASSGLSNLLQYYGSKKATDALVGATDAATAAQLAMYKQTREDYEPWRKTGVWGLEKATNLLQNPNALKDDPAYQFELKEGGDVIERSAASRGGLFSGATLKALQKYGEDHAGTKLDQHLNRYNALSGAGQLATNSLSNVGQNTVNQVSGNIIGAGNARGAGYITQGNVLSNGVNQGYSGWRNDQTTNPYGGRVVVIGGYGS